MSQKARILKNSIYLYIRLGFTTLVALITSRVVLEQLGVDDYGLYSLIGGFVALLAIFTSTFTGSVSRFITFELGKGNKEALRSLILTLINVLLIFAVVILIIGMIIGPPLISHFLNIPEDNIQVAQYVFICSLSAFCVNIMALPYQAIVIAYEKISFYSIISIADSAFKLTSALLLFLIKDHRLYYYATFILLGSIIIRIIYSIYCTKKFSVSKYQFHINKTLFKPIFGFSIWMGFGVMAGTLKDQGLTILLNLFFGLVLNTVRGLSLQVMTLLNQFTASLGLAISPQITKSYSSGNVEESISLTLFSAKIQGYLILLISVPIIICTQFILTLWLKEFPIQTVSFVQWIALSCVIITITDSCNPIFLAIGKIRNFQLQNGIVNISYIVICYIAFKYGAPPVFSMILFAAINVVSLFILIFNIKKDIDFPVKYFIGKCFLTFVLIGICDFLFVKGILYYLEINEFAELVLTVVISSTFLSLSMLLILNQSERIQLKNKIAVFLNKYKPSKQ